MVPLDLLLGQDVREEHLAVQGLHHVLVIVEHLVCLVELLLSEVLLVGLLFSIDASSLDLNFKKLIRQMSIKHLITAKNGRAKVWNEGERRL